MSDLKKLDAVLHKTYIKVEVAGKWGEGVGQTLKKKGGGGRKYGGGEGGVFIK